MAFRRSLSTRSSLNPRRYQTSFSYVLHDDDNNRQQNVVRRTPMRQHAHSFRSWTSANNLAFSHALWRQSHLSLLPSYGSPCWRYMSTTVGEGSEKLDVMSDVAEVLSDTTQAVASQAPAASEVAVAAADSYLPVAALQHLIDMVHTFTGFNWWASIAVTTMLIRGITVPLLINQLKASTKLSLLTPRLEEIKKEMQGTGMEPAAVAKGQKQMQELFKEHGVSPFTPLKGIFIQGPIFVSFFLAISNMVEKVPSFKNGGAYWFTDLTTPDSLYIFPLLTALTFLITVECNAQEGMEGNPAAGKMKVVSRVFAGLTVPLTMSFPKAVFCYWVTSNVFSLMYGQVIKRRGVRKLLNIPIIPASPPSSANKPTFSLLSALKQVKQAKSTRQVVTSVPVQQKKIAEQNSILSQRLRNLEHQVKGRKKNKKR